MSIKLDSDAFEAEVTRLANSKIFAHTIQFMDKGGKFGYSPRASGVLVTTGKKYFIFTAAHVTDIQNNDSFILNTPAGIIEIKAFVRETNFRNNGRIDMAFIELPDKVGILLAEYYQFLPLSQIHHSHQVEENIQYLVLGFPGKSIRKEDDNAITEAVFHFLKGAKNNVYEKYSLMKEHHYVLNFAGKGRSLITKEKMNVDPEPYGLSGCGLWLITGRLIEDQVKCDYCLIGIMTELRKGKYHALIGNRIEILMDEFIPFTNG